MVVSLYSLHGFPARSLDVARQTGFAPAFQYSRRNRDRTQRPESAGPQALTAVVKRLPRIHEERALSLLRHFGALVARRVRITGVRSPSRLRGGGPGKGDSMAEQPDATIIQSRRPDPNEKLVKDFDS